MYRPRVIPVLLIKDGGLVKTVKFKRPTYVGDPINAVRIFNEREVDELFILDIAATRYKRGPDLDLLNSVTGEAFMPVGYGGGLRTCKDIREVIRAGVEKVTIGTAAIENPDFVEEAASVFGCSTIVVSLDVSRDWLGRQTLVTHGGRRAWRIDPVDQAKRMEQLGAGEILLTSVVRDGTFKGLDQALFQQVASEVNIPVVGCGGASSIADMAEAVKSTPISAAAAGSLFVYKGPHRAVLINYPSQDELVGYW